MDIIDIFAIVDESLFSVHFSDQNVNEFTRLFRLWNDPEYLHRFFSKNITDLQNQFWQGITIEEAIEKTREEAKKMEKKFYALALAGQTSKSNLSSFFEPLSKNKFGELERDKAKGISRHSWLRIYAIRIDANFFVVSGGAIKLTETMNERDHLKLELEKLEITRSYILNGENETLEYVSTT